MRPPLQRLALLKYRWEHLAENAWYCYTPALTEISLKTRLAVNELRKNMIDDTFVVSWTRGLEGIMRIINKRLAEYVRDGAKAIRQGVAKGHKRINSSMS